MEIKSSGLDFFFNLFIYLAVSGLSCGMRDLRCGMQDLSLWHVGFFVAVHGLLSSCGMWALEHSGSVVAARGLSSCGAWALEHAGLVALRHVRS